MSINYNVKDAGYDSKFNWTHYPLSPFVFVLDNDFTSYEAAVKSTLMYDSDSFTTKIMKDAYADTADIYNIGAGISNVDPSEILEAQLSAMNFPTIRNWVSSTELGRNDSINCRWGFCEDDDLIHPMSAINGKPHLGGLGRVYSEHYEVTSQRIYLTAGVMEFNTMARFYDEASDKDLCDNIVRGDGKSLTQWMGEIIAAPVKLAVEAIKLPIRFARLAGDILDPANIITRYYDFKSAMPLFYRHVDTIAGTLASNMGLYPHNWFYDSFLTSKDDIANIFENQKQGTGGSASTTQGGNQTMTSLYQNGLGGSGEPYPNDPPNPISDPTSDSVAAGYVAKINSGSKYAAPKILREGLSIYKILAKRDKDPTTGKLTNLPDTLSSFYAQEGETPSANKAKLGEWDIFKHRMGTSFSGADKYVAFRINKSTDSSESLSNQTGETSVAQWLNSTSSSNRDITINTMGGNFADIPILSQVTEAVGSVISNAARSVSVVNLASAILSGSVFMDIPEVWQSSSFSKSYSFDITLRAPYGDPVSIYQSIYVPLSILMALAFPRAAGKNTYGTPFLIRGYCRGMFAIPLGIIDNMSIRRGASEFGWNIGRLPTVVEVNFSIKDLSNITSLALADSGVLSFFNILGANTSFNEYLTTLSGIGLRDRLDLSQMISRRIAATTAVGFGNRWSNPGAYIGMNLADTALGRLGFGFAPGHILSGRTEGYSNN